MIIYNQGMRLALLVLLAACSSSAPSRAADPASAPAKARVPAVPGDSPRHDLYEGTAYRNACTLDSDCHAGGCSHEVCSADEGVITSCIAHEDQPRDATCGCVKGECIWYR